MKTLLVVSMPNAAWAMFKICLVNVSPLARGVIRLGKFVPPPEKLSNRALNDFRLMSRAPFIPPVTGTGASCDPLYSLIVNAASFQESLLLISRVQSAVYISRNIVNWFEGLHFLCLFIANCFFDYCCLSNFFQSNLLALHLMQLISLVKIITVNSVILSLNHSISRLYFKLSLYVMLYTFDRMMCCASYASW